VHLFRVARPFGPPLHGGKPTPPLRGGKPLLLALLTDNHLTRGRSEEGCLCRLRRRERSTPSDS
jgi:hypothetical protein